MNSHETSAIALLREIIDSNLLSESLTKDCLAEIRSLQRGVQKNAGLLEALKDAADATESDYAHSLGFSDGSFPAGEPIEIDWIEWLQKARAAIAESTTPTPPKPDESDSFMQRFNSPESGQRLDNMIKKVDAILSRLNSKETP